MDPTPQVSFNINVTNLRPWIGRRSTVFVRVERLVNEYYLAPNSQPILTSSHHSSAPELFNFGIDCSTNFSQIFAILHDEHELNSQLSLVLTSQIFRKAEDMYMGRSAIMMNVLVKISYDTALDIDALGALGLSPPVEGEESDLVEKLIRDGVIAEESGLEKESCSICLENLLEDSEKIPTRMPCSHFFHDQCILQWLRRKNSCPLCRLVFRE